MYRATFLPVPTHARDRGNTGGARFAEEAYPSPPPRARDLGEGPRAREEEGEKRTWKWWC